MMFEPAEFQSPALPRLAGPETDEDTAALQRWLVIAAYRNAHTFRSYAREAQRFQVFLQRLHADSPTRPRATLLRDATEADVALYEAVLLGKAKPEVYARLGSPFAHADNTGLLRPRALKDSSVSQALNILHALYEFWMQPDPATRQAYVGANPVHRLKRATVRAQRQVQRKFPLEALHAMLQTCDLRAVENPPVWLRAKFLLALLFGLWLRRSEIAKLRACDFSFDGRAWTVTVRRKGGKVQTLPAPEWIMDIYAQYRLSMGLSPIPSAESNEPVILPIRGQKETISDSLIYRILVKTAQQAKESLEAGLVMPELPESRKHAIASILGKVSPHWFRHSGASIAIEAEIMSLENASKVLGHSSAVVTAAMYYHPDEKKISEGLKKISAMFSF